MALSVINDCRTDELCNLKKNLRFRLHDVINTKKQVVINSIKDAFEGENMQTSYSVLGSRIDLYFHKHKSVLEVDELEHAGKNLSNEIEKEKVLEKELDFVFIEINKMHKHTRKSTKTSLIDDISKRLLEL